MNNTVTLKKTEYGFVYIWKALAGFEFGVSLQEKNNGKAIMMFMNNLVTIREIMARHGLSERDACEYFSYLNDKDMTNEDKFADIIAKDFPRDRWSGSDIEVLMGYLRSRGKRYKKGTDIRGDLHFFSKPIQEIR